MGYSDQSIEANRSFVWETNHDVMGSLFPQIAVLVRQKVGELVCVPLQDIGSGRTLVLSL